MTLASESGELTEEPVTCYTTGDEIARLVVRLAGLVANGTAASVSIEISPTPRFTDPDAGQ